jgi:hypothetical protein
MGDEVVMNGTATLTRHRSSSDTVEFQVIGELRDDPHHLLLLGSDGHSYGYAIISGEIRELEPDDSWAVDVVGHVAQRLEATAGKLAT